jgi:hypothetical protein
MVHLDVALVAPLSADAVLERREAVVDPLGEGGVLPCWVDGLLGGQVQDEADVPVGDTVLLAVLRLLLRRIVVHLLLLDLHRDHDVNYIR